MRVRDETSARNGRWVSSCAEVTQLNADPKHLGNVKTPRENPDNCCLNKLRMHRGKHDTLPCVDAPYSGAVLRRRRRVPLCFVRTGRAGAVADIAFDARDFRMHLFGQTVLFLRQLFDSCANRLVEKPRRNEVRRGVAAPSNPDSVGDQRRTGLGCAHFPHPERSGG
jgi:hypothetical protein